MASTLLINARPYETRVALLENGQVVEVYTERRKQGRLAGSIFLGRVARVLPGMQAAFIDVGHNKAAFLYVGDLHGPADANEEPLAQVNTRYRPGNGGLRIEEVLHQGSELMVQVAKEPLGSKGARVTTHITLPGRNLVLMPTLDHVGVSRRLMNEEERGRLRSLVEDLRPPSMGFIARTACEGQSREKLRAEMDFLLSLWESIGRRRSRSPVPALLHQDLSVSLRAVRDLCTREVDHLVIDSPEEYREVIEFVTSFLPRLLPCVEEYTGDVPIFDHFGVEHDLTRALGSKVWLKSGGYVVIEKTEALTAIDVNTGRYVGGHNLEETILKTNLEAVREIAYQIRLRDIGGLIVIDFIDMESETNRERVVEALQEALKSDRSKTNVLSMSPLGLVEMTRKRVRESFAESLTEPCFYCGGSGTIKESSTVCYEIFRELERRLPKVQSTEVSVVVHPIVADVLLMEESQALEELERAHFTTIHVEPDDTLHREQFQLIVS